MDSESIAIAGLIITTGGYGILFLVVAIIQDARNKGGVIYFTFASMFFLSLMCLFMIVLGLMLLI